MTETSVSPGSALLWEAVTQLRGDRSADAQVIAGLRHLRADDRAWGRAYTIRLRRGRERTDAHRAAFLSAYDQAPEGAMVVVQAVDDIGGAAMGDLVARRLRHRRVAGVLLDAPIRDQAELVRIAPATWFTRTSPAGIASREVVVEVGVTVDIAGVRVRDGDIVCADVDGAFVTGESEFQRAAAAAERIEAHEKILTDALGRGVPLGELLVKSRND